VPGATYAPSGLGRAAWWCCSLAGGPGRSATRPQAPCARSMCAALLIVSRDAPTHAGSPHPAGGGRQPRADDEVLGSDKADRTAPQRSAWHSQRSAQGLGITPPRLRSRLGVDRQASSKCLSTALRAATHSAASGLTHYHCETL